MKKGRRKKHIKEYRRKENDDNHELSNKYWMPYV